MRWCLRLLKRGLTEDVDVITYEKEYIEPLVKESISFKSPNDGETYEIGDSITNVIEDNTDNLTKNDIVVVLTTTTILRYKLRKYVNGVAVDEYKDNGKIYSGLTTSEKRELTYSEYELTILG